MQIIGPSRFNNGYSSTLIITFTTVSCANYRGIIRLVCSRAFKIRELFMVVWLVAPHIIWPYMADNRSLAFITLTDIIV